VTSFRIFGFLAALLVALGAWALTCVAWRFDDVAAGVRPLDPRSFERMTLVTVGTGGSYEDPNRRGPVTAVALGEDVALVDAGRGAADALRAARFPVAQPGWVLLTSLLPENTLGLDDVLATGWMRGRREPLRLVGPPGTRALAAAVEAAVRPGALARARALGDDAPPPRFEVVEIDAGWSGRVGGVEVRAGALPGGPTPGFAYRFTSGGHSAVVGGPGWAPDALADFARGTDVLVAEAVYVPTPQEARELGIDEDAGRLTNEATLHTTLRQVGGVARRAGAGTLVLVRLRPPPVFALQITSVVDDTYDGRILVPADGDEIVP
jgi:ribonuclease Z